MKRAHVFHQKKRQVAGKILLLPGKSVPMLSLLCGHLAPAFFTTSIKYPKPPENICTMF